MQSNPNPVKLIATTSDVNLRICIPKTLVDGPAHNEEKQYATSPLDAGRPGFLPRVSSGYMLKASTVNAKTRIRTEIARTAIVRLFVLPVA